MLDDGLLCLFNYWLVGGLDFVGGCCWMFTVHGSCCWMLNNCWTKYVKIMCTKNSRST